MNLNLPLSPFGSAGFPKTRVFAKRAHTTEGIWESADSSRGIKLLFKIEVNAMS